MTLMKFSRTLFFIEHLSWLLLEFEKVTQIYNCSHRRCSIWKDVLKNFAKFTGKHLCQSLFVKKETLAQMFSSEFYEISKNIFFYRTPLVVESTIAYTNPNLQLHTPAQIYNCIHLLKAIVKEAKVMQSLTLNVT